MDKKQLKQDRIRSYFVDAACEIIEESGLAETSVRKVAEKAGYHYTTLYAHFDDFNHVIHYAIMKFLGRISEYISSTTADIADPLERYIGGWEAYCRYLMAHPNIARCIILERTEVPDVFKAAAASNPLSTLQMEYLHGCVEAGCIPAEFARDIVNMMSFAGTGCIVDHLNKRKGLTEEDALRFVGLTLRAIVASVSPR